MAKPIVNEYLERLIAWRHDNPLAVWRERRHLSQRHVAALTDLTEAEVSCLEAAIRDPAAGEWPAITQATGLTPNDWKRWRHARPRVSA